MFIFIFTLRFLPTMVLNWSFVCKSTEIVFTKIQFSWKQKFTFSLKFYQTYYYFFLILYPHLITYIGPILKKDQWFLMCAGFEPSTSRLRDQNVSARLQGLPDLQRTFRSSDCFLTVTIMRSIGHTYRKW